MVFGKVFLTSLVMFMAASEVAFVSAIMRSPTIVIVVSSLFFQYFSAPLIVSSNLHLRRFKGGQSKSAMASISL